MRSNIITSEKKERSMTSIYLRCDLKSFARQTASAKAQPLSRYIEALLLNELAAVNGQSASGSVSASHFDTSSEKDAAPDPQNSAL